MLHLCSVERHTTLCFVLKELLEYLRVGEGA